MENLSYLHIITFSAILLLSVTVEGRVGRVKRQSTFRVISDGQEFPCDGAKMAEYQARGIPRVELNDEQKMELYHQLGGEFLSSFMGLSGQPSNKPYYERGLDKSPWRVGKKVNTRFDGGGSIIKIPNAGLHVDDEADIKTTPTVYEYCNNRTDPTNLNPQYLLMCTSCARSTKQPSDIWPSEFYETDCMAGQGHGSCLFSQGIAYGQCQQTHMYVSILRKRAEECVIALANGNTVVTEDWYLDQIQINIGCECAVNKDSEFR